MLVTRLKYCIWTRDMAIIIFATLWPLFMPPGGQCASHCPLAEAGGGEC